MRFLSKSANLFVSVAGKIDELAKQNQVNLKCISAVFLRLGTIANQSIIVRSIYYNRLEQ